MMSLKQKAYNKNNRFVISLDGPSASGKGLIGSRLATEFKLKYVQSSIVYRGLAYICIKNKVSSNDIHKVIALSTKEDILLKIEGVDLHTEQIGDVASKISAIPEVRENLGKYLIKLIQDTPRIIMEGRDIGTVIAPNADLKIFITADINIRAMRRYKQLQEEGKDCMLEHVLDLLKKRDERDVSRSVAPLRAATGALIVDTSNCTPDQVIQKIKDFVG